MIDERGDERDRDAADEQRDEDARRDLEHLAEGRDSSREIGLIGIAS